MKMTTGNGDRKVQTPMLKVSIVTRKPSRVSPRCPRIGRTPFSSEKMGERPSADVIVIVYNCYRDIAMDYHHHIITDSFNKKLTSATSNNTSVKIHLKIGYANIYKKLLISPSTSYHLIVKRNHTYSIVVA